MPYITPGDNGGIAFLDRRVSKGDEEYEAKSLVVSTYAADALNPAAIATADHASDCAGRS